MLYESKDIGPVPCNSPNLVLDLHICLHDPLTKSIKTGYGIKKNMFALEWQNTIVKELGERWDLLIPSIQHKRKTCQYITIISTILFFVIPLILYFFGNFNVHVSTSNRLLIASSTAFLFLIIASIAAWFWVSGVSHNFRQEFVSKILLNYVNELSFRYDRFTFSILYPVVYYFQHKSDENINSEVNEPEAQNYCVIRISDGVVYCDSQEPIYFTTSDQMREVHSKYSDERKELEYASFTQKSDTNPPILHQMRKDNRKNYSILSPFKFNHTPLINKFDFKNQDSIQNFQNVKVSSVDRCGLTANDE